MNESKMFLSSEIDVLVHWHSWVAIVFKHFSCSWLGFRWVWILWVDPIPTLQWRHYERDGVSNHQPHDCLLNRLFRRRSKKASKLCVTGLCVGNSPVTGEFPTQRASNAENVSIWWRHHEHIDQWPTLINVVMHHWVMLFRAVTVITRANNVHLETWLR